MKLYGLIGHPLGHSFSKKYFTEKFAREGYADARYETFPLPDIADFPALLAAHPDLCGLNVTIPHKETVIPFLDELDPTARKIGAVNCISFQNGKLRGHNTDAFGFEASLRGLLGNFGLEKPLPTNRDGLGDFSALIFGTGGASKAVAFVLGKMGIPYICVSRRPFGEGQITYEALEKLPFDRFRLLINTTPLGTFPNTETCPPLPFDRLTAQHLVFDLVYNPPETLLLRGATARGAATQNGLDMLRFQAEKAWEIWQNLF